MTGQHCHHTGHLHRWLCRSVASVFLFFGRLDILDANGWLGVRKVPLDGDCYFSAVAQQCWVGVVFYIGAIVLASKQVKQHG